MDSIAVLDFGSQYSQLITRRIREQGVFAELLPWDADLSVLDGYTALILSGGPNSVYEQGSPTISPKIFELGKPVLGICYGMQLMAQLLGGKVAKGSKHEYGKTSVQFQKSKLFQDIPLSSSVWMSHGDQVNALPVGFESIASSSNTEIVAMADEQKNIYGIQFHPEVVHTQHGVDMLRNFLFTIANCEPSWKLGGLVKQSIEAIKKEVGEGYVLSALSGGVDSAVSSVLVHRAVGKKLVSVFVDQGTLRLGEVEQVKKSLKKLGLRIIYVDAREQFLSKLEGVTDPEMKRKIIGREFVKVFEETAKSIHEPISHFVQGTLYTDVIESAASHTGKNVAHTIKTHHNVGGLPEKLQWKLIEPLRLLFKDEVRKIGIELELPKKLVYRQPFPGPGLAIRIIGPVTQEKLDVLRLADGIVIDEIMKIRIRRRLWQYFAVLTNTYTVGVLGDARAYGYTVAIRVVESSDGMTAEWSKLPHSLMERMSNRITNEIPSINRVVYDITSKPPATIEWE